MSILKKLKKKIRGIGRRTGLMDDFSWESYNEEEYAKQVYDLERQYTFILPEEKFDIKDGKIKLNKGLLPLNEHHEALYESLLKLKPDSVIEIGFGAGDHLINIKKLMPNVSLSGIDLLKTQLEFLYKRHPDLKNQAELLIKDITLSPVKEIITDVAYTQAVLMHIQRHHSYLSALKNIFYSAKKYVVLQENWTRHHFFDDIKKVSELQDFAWKNIYCYIHNTGQQIALILSTLPLPNFKEITSNDELLKYYK